MRIVKSILRQCSRMRPRRKVKNMSTDIKENLDLDDLADEHTFAKSVWSPEKSLYLIKHYKSMEILWNPQNEFYYNHVKKEEAWRDLSKVINEPIDVVKRKMESLRGSYRREKARNRKRSHKNSDYVSHWFAYEHMKFLSNIKIVKSINSTSSQNNKNNNLINNENISESVVEPEKPTISKLRLPKIQLKSPPNKRPNKSLMVDFIKKIKTEQEDECSIYAKYIAQKLRKFDSITKAHLENQINTLLFEAEMQGLTQN